MKPCFVGLTERGTKTRLWVNMNHVIQMNQNGDQPSTVLVYSTGGIDVVEEPMDQILDMVPA